MPECSNSHDARQFKGHHAPLSSCQINPGVSTQREGQRPFHPANISTDHEFHIFFDRVNRFTDGPAYLRHGEHNKDVILKGTRQWQTRFNL